MTPSHDPLDAFIDSYYGALEDNAHLHEQADKYFSNLFVLGPAPADSLELSGEREYPAGDLIYVPRSPDDGTRRVVFKLQPTVLTQGIVAALPAGLHAKDETTLLLAVLGAFAAALVPGQQILDEVPALVIRGLARQRGTDVALSTHEVEEQTSAVCHELGVSPAPSGAAVTAALEQLASMGVIEQCDSGTWRLREKVILR